MLIKLIHDRINMRTEAEIKTFRVAVFTNFSSENKL